MEPAGLFDLYRRVRTRSEALAAPLTVEDQVVQTMTDVSPTKWHLAHTTWFFETFVLARCRPDVPPFDPRFHDRAAASSPDRRSTRCATTAALSIRRSLPWHGTRR
jgi:hypothetical protein